MGTKYGLDMYVDLQFSFVPNISEHHRASSRHSVRAGDRSEGCEMFSGCDNAVTNMNSQQLWLSV